MTQWFWKTSKPKETACSTKSFGTKDTLELIHKVKALVGIISIMATGLLMHWTSYRLFANHHQLRTTCVAPIRLWYHTLRHQLPVGQLKMGSWRKRCDHLAPQGLRAEVDWLYQMIGTRYSISTGYTIELLSLVFVHSEGLRAPTQSWNVSCIY